MCKLVEWQHSQKYTLLCYSCLNFFALKKYSKFQSVSLQAPCFWGYSYILKCVGMFWTPMSIFSKFQSEFWLVGKQVEGWTVQMSQLKERLLLYWMPENPHEKTHYIDHDKTLSENLHIFAHQSIYSKAIIGNWNSFAPRFIDQCESSL